MKRVLSLSLCLILGLWLAACTPATPPPTSTPAPTIHSEPAATAIPQSTLTTTATEQTEAESTPTT
ncbi:MAG: hypothetical protein H6658_15115, partial [Ardenticatenaceae bacterium]|nr:hypothetical protein [Ardenticatenaceae bacterium]